jgi:hypothetical protein
MITSISFPDDVYAELKAAAKRENRSLSYMVVKFCRSQLSKNRSTPDVKQEESA